MAVNYISIGERIKQARKRRGLSQNSLAETIDRSHTYVSYIESGIKGMSLDTFLEIANALNATADELLADNLVNTVKVSNHEFASLLSDCSEYEKKVLFDVISATKASLRSNRPWSMVRPPKNMRIFGDSIWIPPIFLSGNGGASLKNSTGIIL